MVLQCKTQFFQKLIWVYWNIADGWSSETACSAISGPSLKTVWVSQLFRCIFRRHDMVNSTLAPTSPLGQGRDYYRQGREADWNFVRIIVERLYWQSSPYLLLKWNDYQFVYNYSNPLPENIVCRKCWDTCKLIVSFALFFHACGIAEG